MSGSLSKTYLYNVMGLLIGLIVLLAINNSIFSLKVDKLYYFILFFLLYIFVVGYPVAGFFYTAKQVGSAVIQFSPLIIYLHYNRNKNESAKHFVFKCIYIILFYYLISSYFAYTRFGVEARRIANRSANYGDLSIGGGYSFAYAIALLSVYFFDRLKNRAIVNPKERVVYIIFIILSTIVIFETRSTITVLAYLAGLLFSLISPVAKSEKNYYLVFLIKVLFLIVVVVCIFLLKSSIGFLIVSIGSNINNVLGDRVQSLGYLLLNSDSGSYAAGRIAIPLYSFRTFLEYPIFGIAYFHGNGFYNPSLFGAGNHCEWVDALTNYGLIGGLPMLYLYFSSIKKTYRNNKKKLGIGVWVTFIILGLFNPFRSIQTSMVMFFIMPIHTDLHN